MVKEIAEAEPADIEMGAMDMAAVAPAKAAAGMAEAA